MISIEDIYVSFRKAQSEYNNRPYKIPVDITAFLQKRLSEANLQSMKRLAAAMNTNYHNIDLDRYLEYGFELFGKNFSYMKFLDQRLINFYIMKDKNLKRDTKLIKETLEKTISFVKEYMGNCDDLYSKYGSLRNGYESIPVYHYNKGRIDRYFLTWLIFKNYLRLTDEDKELVPLISEQYRNYVYEFKKSKLLENIERGVE